VEGGIAFVNKDGLVLGGNDSVSGESEEQDKVMDNPIKNEKGELPVES
jgi:hypothetical protein